MNKQYLLRLILGWLMVFMGSSCLMMQVDLKPKEELQEQFVSGDNSSSNKVLLMSISGVILADEVDNQRSDAATPGHIKEMLEKAGKDKQVKALILEIDSPGGGVTASDMIYTYLKDFRKDHNIPIIALMKDVAASGAYYISMASDYIIAHPTSVTGSIGVISIFVTIPDLLRWLKVEVVVVKSGDAKDAGSPFRKMTKEEKAKFQEIIDEMYAGFVDIVAGNRKSLSRDEIKSLADGRIFTGRKALEAKLVDAIGYDTSAINKAKELAQLKDAKVVRYKKPQGVLESALRLQNNQTEIDRLSQAFCETLTNKFMYLWLPGAE